VPAIILNALGVAAIIGLLDSIFQEKNRLEGVATHLSLEIAKEALAFLRSGLSRQSAEKTVKTILAQVKSLDAVAITSLDSVLAFAGPGEDHHSPVSADAPGLFTESTRRALKTGVYQVVQKAAEIGCSVAFCPLKSKVVVPLKEYDQIVGSLVLYRTVENGISYFDIQLALGLAELISSQLTAGKRQQEAALLIQAELKALQAQINPHFLFNALNTIAFYCRTQPEVARDLIVHLAGFYRNILDRSEDMIDLETEIEHVKSYLKIEMARFGDKIEVVYDIGPGCACLVPPLILQPIVENAVRHGLYQRRGGGKLIIGARRQGDLICLSVEDNGVGMDEATRLAVLGSEPLSREKVGLANVNARLKMMYPRSPGLQIESIPGKGTRVTIPIPCAKRWPDDNQSAGS